MARYYILVIGLINKKPIKSLKLYNLSHDNIIKYHLISLILLNLLFEILYTYIKKKKNNTNKTYKSL